MIFILIILGIVTAFVGWSCPSSEGLGPELLLSFLMMCWFVYAIFNLMEIRRSVSGTRRVEGIFKLFLSACLIVLIGPFLLVGKAKDSFAIVKDMDGRNIRVEHGLFTKWPLQEFVKQELDPRGGTVSLSSSSPTSASAAVSYVITVEISFEWENKWLMDGVFSLDAFQSLVDDAMRETAPKYTRERLMIAEGSSDFQHHLRGVVGELLRSRNLELKGMKVKNAFVQVQVI